MARLLQLVVAKVVHGRDRAPAPCQHLQRGGLGLGPFSLFFVERSELTWSEEAGKLLTLSRRLPQGAMIFVRLLQPTDGERAFPVAYETEALSDASERLQQFRITRVVPRTVVTESA